MSKHDFPVQQVTVQQLCSEHHAAWQIPLVMVQVVTAHMGLAAGKTSCIAAGLPGAGETGRPCQTGHLPWRRPGVFEEHHAEAL